MCKPISTSQAAPCELYLLKVTAAESSIKCMKTVILGEGCINWSAHGNAKWLVSLAYIG
jgi:hypothetical protein